jgi:ribosome biogenesis GTPase
VLALGQPPVSFDLIDRLLVLVEASGMSPILVLNKLDLDGAPAVASDFEGLYEGIGYKTLSVSAVSGDGLESLHSEIRLGSSALIGPSGVGKSSLLNALDPELGLRTHELSRKSGGGRHTTVSSRMIRLTGGGLIADTPGFSDVALWEVPPEEVAPCFPEFADPASICRFRSCTHVEEPHCGVRTGVEKGRIHESRYSSYLKLRIEAVAAAK